MNQQIFKTVIIGFVALVVSIYLGVGAATQSTRTVIMAVAVGGAIVTLLLGRRVWLLAIFLGALGITLHIPGRPDTQLLGRALLIGMACVLFLMRRFPLRIRFTELEFWGLALALLLLQAYLRNPVGLNIFGGATVGARPYFEVALAIGYAIILSVMVLTTPRELKWAMWCVIVGSLVAVGLGIAGRFAPAIGMFFAVGGVAAAMQGGGHSQALMDDYFADERATRDQTAGRLSNILARTTVAFISPVKAVFHPVWAPVVLLSLVAAGLSGFRSAVAMVGLIYIIGICYRGGIAGLFIASIVLALGLMAIPILQSITPLPPNIQRSFSFLPGNWDGRHIHDTRGSTEWRTEMWIEALTSERYIRNKAFGDGLGMTREQLERSAMLNEMQAQGLGGWDVHRENVMISGDYHSGPVHTIRTIGYFGLAVLLIAMIRLAMHAHRQIERCRGTEYFPMALFFGVPMIVSPIFFVFVFGEFAGGMASYMVGAGMIRLMQNNLPLPEYVKKPKQVYVPLSTRGGAREAGREDPPPVAGAGRPAWR